MGKKILFTGFTIVAFIAIGWIFWKQELKYAMPTPRPVSFIDVDLGTTIALNLREVSKEKVTVLHFFNPDCPCSRFDMANFQSMTKRYSAKANFIVVLQAEDNDAIEDFKDKYAVNLPVVLDKNGEISDQCGVYSTPQAVILDKNLTLYFKGNYNKSRFCTRKETSYAEIALDSLLVGRALPHFVQNELTVPYGCSLPSDETGQSSFAFF
jgi:peroxiredoxin